MTKEEKAKAYDEVLNKFRHFMAQGVDPLITRADVQDFFPELKESEDERIRKTLIDYFNTCHGDYYGELKRKDILAWLEKQAKLVEEYEDKLDRCACESFNKGYKAAIKHQKEKQGEQKPFDYENANIQQKDFAPKDEPRFKIGDWIINRTDATIMQIINNKDFYESVEIGGQRRTDSYNYVEWDFRLWTIQDAKDGDVIYLPNGNNEYYLFIFKGIENAAVMSFAHFYQYNDGTSVVEGTIDNLYSVNDVFQPATKEQRDLLFQKMHEAGYEWDAEKKEVKKIEQKPTDEEIKTLLRTEYEKGRADAIAEMQNLAWSEEDMSKVQRICKYLNEAKKYYADTTEVRDCMDWLKSLKERINK